MDYYPFDPEHREPSEPPQYPYQEYYGTGDDRKPPKRSGHGGLWVLVVLLLVAAGTIALLRRYSVEVRRTDGGMTFSIQDAPQQKTQESDTAQEPSADNESLGASVLRPSAIGSGTQLILSSAPGTMPAAPADGQKGLSLQEIYKKVLPSVVSITSTLRTGTGTGTGIIMDADGYIITNDHVVDDAVAIEVLTSDNQTFSASLVGSDATSDLAVLKVDAQRLSAAEFGDSESMVVGDTVVAIGDPLGKELRGTMTDGIISAINRDLVVNGRSMTLMQTNAALNNGNSGGPLINAYGQVIGINTMKMSSYYTSATVEGLGFAIPISTAKPIIDELIDHGYVSGRPALGISGGSLPATVRIYYNLPDGIYVDSVDQSSDAYAKGIRKGDTITAIADVEVHSMEDLNAVKNQYEAGDTVTLTVYRGGEYYSVDVTLADAAGR